jgi:peptide-methionine (R)-S-oxide reductase
MRPTALLLASIVALLLGCSRPLDGPEDPMSRSKPETPSDPPARRETPEQLRARLTSEQWRVTQEKATERPFTGRYWDVWDDGTYRCIVCGAELFRSDSKFDAGCGWPSFSTEAVEGNVAEHVDTTHGMVRTEVTCKRCGAHLGHVFDDGPGPTRLRYCINSASIDLLPDVGSPDEGKKSDR